MIRARYTFLQGLGYRNRIQISPTGVMLLLLIYPNLLTQLAYQNSFNIHNKSFIMTQVTNKTVIGILSFFLFAGLFAFKPAETPLATVSKGADGYVYSNINKSLVNPKIAKGRLTLAKVNFHHVDDTFYLVRKVKTQKGRIGFLFSEVKHLQDKLYPIENPKLFWPCWQTASCNCARPSAYEECVCNGGGTSGCVQDWGGPGFEDLFDFIYIG